MTNPEILSLERVQEILSEAEKATAGPWEFTGGDIWRGVYDNYGEPVQELIATTSELTAPFIANSRTNIPELCASHEALRAHVAELEAKFAEALPERAPKELVRAFLQTYKLAPDGTGHGNAVCQGLDAVMAQLRERAAGERG